MGEASRRSDPVIAVPPWWEEAADSIAYDSLTYPPPIALVCGPGNSGKSTFSRILLDTLLKRYKKVGYLDTDLGQPEFTVPGCLSLHIIDERTPDLTILCLKMPERCFYYGDLTPKRDRKAYLDNISSLYDYFRKQYHQSAENDNDTGKLMLPLVVNTSGWVKGTGYDVLVDMLRNIAPSHVIQIRTSAESKNLPTGMFWLEGDQKEPINLFELCAAPKTSSNRAVLIQKDARIMRDLRIISYFRQCLPSDLNISSYKELAKSLASIPPYELPLSRVNTVCLNGQVSSSEMRCGLKDSIVGLGISSWRPTRTGYCTPWCIGLGIVRAVDISKNLVCVITPIPLSNLKRVDLLLKGCIELPTCLLQVPGCLSSQASATMLHRLKPSQMDAQVTATQKMFSEVLSI